MEKINLKEIMPLRDTVIAKIEVKASKAGIILSDAAKENSEHVFKAVKIGPDVKYVQKGDILLVNPYEFMNNKIKLDDEHYIISELAIIAVKRLE